MLFLRITELNTPPRKTSSSALSSLPSNCIILRHYHKGCCSVDKRGLQHSLPSHQCISLSVQSFCLCIFSVICILQCSCICHSSHLLVTFSQYWWCPSADSGHFHIQLRRIITSVSLNSLKSRKNHLQCGDINYTKADVNSTYKERKISHSNYMCLPEYILVLGNHAHHQQSM